MLKALRLSTALVACVLAVAPAAAQVRTSPADSALAESILRELIGIRSVSGSTATWDAARALAARLRAGGFSEQDAFAAGPNPQLGNLVARLRGRSSARPILFIGHLDVVDARRDDWSVDPFVLTDSTGWWYGRGTGDDKGPVVELVTNLIRWKRDGFVPERDLVVVITGDEETNSNGIKWFMNGEGRALIGNPEYALNFDEGEGSIYGGREAILQVQTSEKIYVSYRLRVRNPGGHSSLPRSDNAIYTLARALTRLAEHRFPVQLNETTRAILIRSAAFEPDSVARLMRAVVANPAGATAAAALSAIPRFNALLRSTCVATRLAAGHADNALPQTAEATVNCRLLPGTDVTGIAPALRAVIAEPDVEISQIGDATPSPPSPLTPAIIGTIERIASSFWPGVVVVPKMSTGATDGAYVRNAGIPVYGVVGRFTLPDEERAHGRDERIEISRFYEDLEYTKRLVEALARR